MSVQPTRLALATALAVVALLGAACSAGQPAATTAPTGTAGASATAGAAAPSTGTGGTSTPSGASGLSADQAAQAHQAALGLVALGGLGGEKGTTDALRTLAGRVTAEGRALDEQIRTLATAQGLTLSDDVGAQIQGVLNDLQARNGQPFDQAWLRAVGDLVEQGRAAANAVLSSPDASDEAKAAARDALARLDALAAALRDAAGAAGAGTPIGGERGHGRPGRGGAGAARRAGRAGRPAARRRRPPAAPPCVARGRPVQANAASGRPSAPNAAFALHCGSTRRPGVAVWAAAGARQWRASRRACCWSAVPAGPDDVGRGAGALSARQASLAVATRAQPARRSGGDGGDPGRSAQAGTVPVSLELPGRGVSAPSSPPPPDPTAPSPSPTRPPPSAGGPPARSPVPRRARRSWSGTSTPPRPGSGCSRCSATSLSASGCVLRGADGRLLGLPGDRPPAGRQGRAARRPVRPRRAAPARAGHLRRPVRPGDPALHRQRRRLRGPGLTRRAP